VISHAEPGFERAALTDYGHVCGTTGWVGLVEAWGDDPMTDSDRFARLRFSTADLPEHDRVAMWRDHYGRTVLRVDIEPERDTPFSAAITSRLLPDLHVLSGMMSAARIQRTRQLIADGNNDLALVINRWGTITARARGREVTLREGDALLMNSSEMIAFDRSDPGSSISIRIPHSVLSPLVVHADDAVMRPIPRATDALRLLTRYAEPLLEDGSLSTPELRRLAVSHVHDLVALTLGATRDATELAESRGVRAARLSAAKGYIVSNSSSRNLSIGHVAKHLGVTPRYLQKLFERGGSTFSAFVLGQRLARARRLLTDPKFGSYQVSSIAYDVGFGDLSYFNRCFRQHYGATPRDVRDAAAKLELR
jgi:AraC-like DNA-binding protein